MLTKIRLKNFKCFKNTTEFPLSKINLLTGINGRGKSSLLQAMLLFRQSIEHNSSNHNLLLNGSCIQLGSFDDVKNSETLTDMPITIGFSCNISSISTVILDAISLTNTNDTILDIIIQFQVNKDTPRVLAPIDLTVHSKAGFLLDTFDEEDKPSNTPSAQLSFTNLQNSVWQNKVLNSKGDVIRVLSGKSVDFFPMHKIAHNPPILESISLFGAGLSFWFPFRTIHYVAADRIGPKNTYNQENLDSFVNTGPTGKNTATILNLLGGKKTVDNKLYLGEDAQTLLQQTEEWLNYIFDGAKITITLSGDNINITYNTNSKSYRYRPTNVGFGYSYILPIVVSGLIANENETLIVENPEAHLHPRAQNRLTEFLSRVATCGVQVFIESHSEHILNALRVVSLNDNIEIKHDDISVLYFQDNDEEPFVSIPIDEKGGIDNWPSGFFDQTDKDFKILFGF